MAVILLLFLRWHFGLAIIQDSRYIHEIELRRSYFTIKGVEECDTVPRASLKQKVGVEGKG